MRVRIIGRTLDPSGGAILGRDCHVEVDGRPVLCREIHISAGMDGLVVVRMLILPDAIDIDVDAELTP